MYLKFHLSFASVILMKYTIILFWNKCENFISKKVVYHINEYR